MLYRLKRNPLTIYAHIEFSLCLTYAVEAAVLRPFVPTGLSLDTRDGLGFLAVVMGQTRRLRPALARWLPGRDFALAAYRVFVTYGHEGRTMRGLRVVRTEVNSRVMAALGRATTHYGYRYAPIDWRRKAENLTFHVRAPGEALAVHANVGHAAGLPGGSVFESVGDASRFVAPLPWTFDPEPQTRSIVRTEGVRQNWAPRPVNAEVETAGFLTTLAAGRPRLSGAFFIEEVPYTWRRGQVTPLPA